MKMNGCRTDNQPGAVRASASVGETACCPERAELPTYEKKRAPESLAKATGPAVLRVASSAMTGRVNKTVIAKVDE